VRIKLTQFIMVGVAALLVAGCDSSQSRDVAHDAQQLEADVAPSESQQRAEARKSQGTRQPENGVSEIADPFVRADASFSRYPLNKKTTPQAIGRLVNGDRCDDEDLACEWEDAEGTRHILGGDVLAIKIISGAVMRDRPIRALGIGRARYRKDVVARVRAFLPEIEIRCLEDGDAGEGNGNASCGGSFDNGGWFKLLFDGDGQLFEARIDAFQIN
jgi:outer membrane murein-binding lipoprotein Lpp